MSGIDTAPAFISEGVKGASFSFNSFPLIISWFSAEEGVNL